jgi:glycosyltransferase involved in cell wall biosynthesis
MRILVDLQACQVDSAFRGIGRYSMSLLDNLIDQAGTREISPILFNAAPHKPFINSVSPQRIIYMPAFPNWVSVGAGAESHALNSLAYSTFIQSYDYDILHISSAFEPWLPDLSFKAPGQIVSATLYDLIPMIFKEHYFSDKAFKHSYLQRLAWLRNVDLILAISDASRDDAIELLGIEPSRIVSIYGGIPKQLSSESPGKDGIQSTLNRYFINKPFVLYTGGDEYRKNLNGAIAAFAELPAEVKEKMQLVIVCALSDESRAKYSNQARKLGLSLNKDIVFTGFVSDFELACLYSSCEVFMFPSWYEGLGLPVLEAMSYGAPVIGGNNSSIREIIKNPNALFDARSTHDMAHKLYGVLNNSLLADELRHYGKERVKDFSFERASVIALNAFDEALERAKCNSENNVFSCGLPRKRLAYLTPMPPAQSGISEYSAEQLLPWLSRYFNIDIYTESDFVSDSFCNAAFRIFNCNDFPAVAEQYDFILYAFGNSAFHSYMFEFIQKYPGVIVLHDTYLGGILHQMNSQTDFEQEVLFSHGSRARKRLLPQPGKPYGAYEVITELPSSKRVLNNALGVIVHSPYNLKTIRETYPEGIASPFCVIPQPLFVPKIPNRTEKGVLRYKLGIDENAVIFASFGHVAHTKHVDMLLDAFEEGEFLNAYLVFVGKLYNDDFGLEFYKRIKKSKYSDRIIITDFISNDEYVAWLSVADISIQLRKISMGETSKAVLDCMSMGIAVILNDFSTFQDYPSNVVCKIPHPVKKDDLVAAMNMLYYDAEKRTTLGSACRDYVKKNHDPSGCAVKYADAVHRFYARDSLKTIRTRVNAFAPHLVSCESKEMTARVTAEWLSSIPKDFPERLRIFWDVSDICEKTETTDTEKHLIRLLRKLYCLDITGVEFIAVKYQGDEFIIAKEWLNEIGVLLSAEKTDFYNKQVKFNTGDILAVLSASFDQVHKRMSEIFDSQGQQVPIIAVDYDTLPLLINGIDDEENNDELFARRLEFLITRQI